MKELFLQSGKLNPDVFDASGLKVLELAAVEAQQVGQLVINTAHAFIALAQIPNGATVSGLRAQSVNPDDLTRSLRSMLQQLPPLIAPVQLNYRSISPNVKQLMEIACGAAERAGEQAKIEEKHLLLGVLGMKTSSTLQTLTMMGLKLGPLYEAAGETPPVEPAAAGPGSEVAPLSKSGTPLLDKLGRDLTLAAQKGELNPVLGRRDEIQRMIQTLVRQQKNNAILIGEAGTGKTAIVEGLAQKIATGKVPPQLKDRRIMEVPISNLVAGTQYRGQFEERLNAIIEEAKRSNVILFFDEIHTLMGAGEAGGTLDASNILKPALARGDLHCIGATTPKEFARTIEKDAALERRFQPVYISELDPESTLEILRHLKQRYESYYGVKIQDEALDSAVRLSVSYLHQRYLPDKAIDLLEETCAQSSVQAFSPGSQSTSAAVEEKPVPAEITPESIAAMLSRWTGIPISGITQSEGEKLTDMERILSKQIIGQGQAVSAVANCLRVGRAGLRPEHRPVGVLLFLGPSGVGKTALAYSLAKEVYGSEDALFRLDMSEFMEQHSSAKLIGAPPGYVGYENEGVLTGRLRRTPHGIVLLDEIEKAHPAVFDLLLQLFDNGCLTDSQGRQAMGENTLFIMTSNLIPKVEQKSKRPIGFLLMESMESDGPDLIDLRDSLIGTFRVEFLNRLDEIILFNELGEEDCRQICLLKLAEVQLRAAAKRLQVEFEPAAIDLIASAGFSKEYGARYLQRAIEQLVTRPLGEMIVRGAQGTVVCRVDESRLVFDLKKR